MNHTAEPSELWPSGPSVPLPFVPDLRAAARRRRRNMLAVAVLLFGVGLLSWAGWYATRVPEVDPAAPRVTLEVRGMHCPITCGLRVARALETLPWVVRGSVEADPARQRVHFAVTDRTAVDLDAARAAIWRQGFEAGAAILPEARHSVPAATHQFTSDN